MVATSTVSIEEKILKNLQVMFSSSSVLSKKFILDNDLFVVVVDDNHLYDNEGQSLISALQNLGVKKFNWGKVADILNPTESALIHAVNSTYDDFLTDYLNVDESIQYWDRVIFTDDLSTIVLHTAHDHIIYAGSHRFVDEATRRSNQFGDTWLSVIGSAFADPNLIDEYQLHKNEEGEI